MTEEEDFDQSLGYTKNAILEWGVNGSIAVGLIFGIVVGGIIYQDLGLFLGVLFGLGTGAGIIFGGLIGISRINQMWFNKWKVSGK